nr:histone deacetylase 14 [Tanacetum cinerariifolium]
AFTASSTIPSIYIQRFWDTILYDKKVGCYKRQLDEQWFDLTKETLREALQITPVNHNQAFVAPPSIDGLIDFVNQLGYPKKHRFHPSSDSPLHLSNEEPVLGYLKFSAKGTKSEVFGMPIPDSLITVEIQQATYYREYLAKVIHHRKYLAGETGGVQNPPAPKPTQPARKPKAPTRPSISIPIASTQPAPTSAPAKSQENKRKQATETTDKPAKAKRIKHSISRMTRQPRSSSKSVGASEVEEVPAEEPQVADEDADYQKAVEESMKDAYALPKGPLPQLVIREPESGKYQPLPEVPGKGRLKLDQILVMLKLKYNLFQDREHMDLDVADVSPQPSTEQLDESDKHSDADKNAETEVESMVNVTIQQALSSISLMTSPIIDLTSRPESPKEHQQLKATTTDTTTTTTTTLPPPQAPQQSTTEAMMVKRIGELERIMTYLIQVNKDMEERLDSHGSRLYTLEQLDIPQRVSIAVSEVVTDAVDWAMQAPLCNRFRDLLEADMKEILHHRMWESDSYKSHEDHMQLFEALEKSMNRDHSEELTQDLAEARKKRKKSRESPKTPPGSPSHQLPPPPPLAGPSGASGAPRASGSAQMPPSPPPPSSTNQESPSKGSATPSPSKTAASAEYQAWMTTDIKLRPQGWWKPFEEERPTTLEPAWSIRSSDVPVPTNNWASALASNYSPPPEDSLLAQT